MEYKVISEKGYNLEFAIIYLEQSVNKLQVKGWVYQGGVSCFKDNGYYRVSQAMVKE